MNLKHLACKILNCCEPFKQIEKDYAHTKTRLEDARREIKTLQETRDATIGLLEDAQQEILILESKAKALENDVDTYARKKHPQIPNRVYTNKRASDGEEYDTSINEWIQPRSYAVQYLTRHEHNKKYANTYTEVKSIGNLIARTVTWTSDQNLHDSPDYYQSPAETLSTRRGDCEDHAFILASALPTQVAVAYGYYKDGVGHAFNVFVMNEELWIADTVTSTCQIHRYESDTHDYKIHFIITPKHTYMMKPGVEFGRLAGWLPEVERQ